MLINFMRLESQVENALSTTLLACLNPWLSVRPIIGINSKKNAPKIWGHFLNSLIFNY